MRGLRLVVVAALVGCSSTRHPPDPRASRPAALASVTPTAGPRCGATPCRVFPDARTAFAAVMAERPRVLAVGESHPLAGTEEVEPSTRRFMRDMLPLLAGHASDIVIELMLPNPKCAPEGQKARQEQKVVTEHQAKTDQSDYVELGTRAKALGIRPHALEPTCDDLARMANAGADVVTLSLDVVTRLATAALSELCDANAASGDSRTVVAYGGLMHNDVQPAPERAQWTFGPAMMKRTAERYTELDLVAPEQVKDTPTWRSLPWVAGFDRDAHPHEAVLLSPSPHGYVLLFPRGAAAPPTARPAPSASP